MSGGPIDLWNEWAIQILVLLSFTLQVHLLILAGIRRREASPFPVLRLLLWLAYQLADSTAIYALGLLSLSRVQREHQLTAFWAPFLLLHLGGPDNITAYSLEDSKLWKRHLLTVLVQVLGVVYVLYKNITGSSEDLFLAAILMFFVGAIKYAERTWALKCSNMDSIRSSLIESLGDNNDNYLIPKGVKGELSEQVLLEVAHSLFHFCKLKLVDSPIKMDRPDRVLSHLEWNDKWNLMELELSLLYDLLYTKAAVIHTWFGYCIRLLTPFASASALLLFHFSNNGFKGHSGVDVAITYTLLAGALFMEVNSLLGAIGSTWTLAFLRGLPMQWSWLRHALVCNGRWRRFRRLLLSLGLLDTRRRRWSGTIGQYNLLRFCSRDSSDELGKLAEILGKLAEILGQEKNWNKSHYSKTLVVSENVKESLIAHCEAISDRENVNALGLLRAKWGKWALDKNKLYKYICEKDDHLLGAELQEGILIWHIATEVFLANRDGRHDDDAAAHGLVGVIKELSDYMMFLLVRRPYLLPGLVLHRMYQLTCENLEQIWCKANKSSLVDGSTTREPLAKILYRSGKSLDFKPSDLRVKYGVDIATILILIGKEKPGKTNLLKALRDVWMDFLSYTANRCNRESFAMKLNNGGELTAILWLMAAHFQPNNQASSTP